MSVRIELEREAFEHALFGIQSIAQKRAATPVLANVRLKAETDVELYATDYDVSLTTRVANADVLQAGVAALPARLLYDIVKRSQAERIELSIDEQHQATLRTGTRSHYKLVGMDPEAFPQPVDSGEISKLELNRADFRLWIKKTLFAAAKDDSRQALAGVFLEAVEDEQLRLVATDTHRLALIDVPDTQVRDVIPEDGILLPVKALQELNRILVGDGKLTTAVSSPYVWLFWNDVTFVFRTGEGRFPSYRAVIPEQAERSAIVDRVALIEALERVSLVVTDRFKGVLVKLSGETMTLAANNPDMGEAEESLDCDLQGEPAEVGFNAQYLQDALAEITTDRVELRITDEVSPTLIYGEGDTHYLNVVMPMRI